MRDSHKPAKENVDVCEVSIHEVVGVAWGKNNLFHLQPIVLIESGEVEAHLDAAETITCVTRDEELPHLWEQGFQIALCSIGSFLGINLTKNRKTT